MYINIGFCRRFSFVSHELELRNLCHIFGNATAQDGNESFVLFVLTFHLLLADLAAGQQEFFISHVCYKVCFNYQTEV